MKLTAGERFELKGQECLWQLESGTLEVYAVTRRKDVYRQLFIMECKPGAAVFPAMDEFEHIKLFVYAEDEVELTEQSWEGMEPAKLRQLMRGWLTGLAALDWVRHLADLGDDMLVPWVKGTVLTDVPDEGLSAAFIENQGIFSMLAGVRFQSEDKQWQQRVSLRERQKKRLIAEGMDCLLGEQNVRYEETTKKAALNEAMFIVQQVAAAFSMPVENITLSPELVKRMDPDKVLKRLIQKGNMQVRFIRLEKNWQHMDSGTLIGFYGENHTPAALIQREPGRYQLITKEHPDGLLLTDEMETHLAREAYMCYAGLPRRKLKILDLMRFMFHQCWKKDYMTIIGASLAASIMPLLTPIVTETIFQDVIPIQDRMGLATITQVLMVAGFSMAAVAIVRSIAVLRITTHLDIMTEAALWNRLLSLPAAFFRQFTVGELTSRMGGISAVKGVVNGQFVATIFNTIFSFWSLFLMCWYSVKLAAVAVAVWLVYCIVIAFIYRRVLGFQRKAITAGNKYNGMVQQIFAGLSKFRIQGAEAQAYNIWSRYFGESWKWNLKLRWQGNYNSVITSIEPFILSMLLYYVALYGMTSIQPDGTQVVGITYPEFLAFSAAYGSFNGCLGAVIPLVGTFFTIQPHIENLRPILDAVPETGEDKVDADILTGAVEVSHLSFSYTKNGPEILHDVNFKATPGETLAIVGRSGGGKSTLVRLLLGFEQPNKGAVSYDGQDLSDLSLPSVRSQMGIVLQNGQLMSGDIFTNIIGTSNLTQDDAWAAAEAAGVADDIRQMPMGMQTVISEGSSNISGGQRQRILIARALAGRPKFIIFDEATSALDNRTQAIVTESLSRLHVTRIIVAHRLSTIRDADRILVMDAGSIAESGTFDELVNQDGIFASLVRRQVA